MKIKVKQIKVLAMVFTALFAIMIFLAVYSPKNGEEKSAKSFEITKIALNDVGAIAITNDKSAYGLFVDGINVYMESAVEGNYSQSEMRTIVYAISNLIGTKEIKNPKNPEEYGFDTPLARITVIMLDKSLVKLALLNQNPVDGGYYLFSEDKQAIYTISKEVGQLFLREEKDFYEKTIFPIISTENIDKVTSLKVEYANGLGRSYQISGADSNFKLDAPISANVEALRVVSDLLLPMSALYADSVFEETSDLSALGFDKYSHKLTLVFDGKEYVAAFTTYNGKQLMADLKLGTVFEIGEDTLSFLKSDYITLFNGKAYAFSLGDINNILVEFSNTVLNMDVFGESTEIYGKFDNKKLDYQGLVAFYAILNNIEIAGEVDSVGDFVADIKMTVTKKQGSVDVVEIGKNQDGACYVRVNGKTNFVTTANIALQIKTTILALK